MDDMNAKVKLTPVQAAALERSCQGGTLLSTALPPSDHGPVVLTLALAIGGDGTLGVFVADLYEDGLLLKRRARDEHGCGGGAHSPEWKAAPFPWQLEMP
jgi:hypothetical protein